MALVRSNDDQVERYKTYVRSLNEQFARWIVQQWETKSDKFWSHGMVDYLRHAVIIKRDHPDAAALLGTAQHPSAAAQACMTCISSEHVLRAGQKAILRLSLLMMRLQQLSQDACAESNGKQERKHEAQLTILPVQHSKVCHLSSVCHLGSLLSPVPQYFIL